MSTSGRNQSRNFYPRPPRGGRQKGVLTRSVFTLFLSTPSARRATDVLELRTSELKNFYPRPPRGGRRCGQEKQAVGGVISIHALREEGDAFTPSGSARPSAFLSTPSARRATATPPLQLTLRTYFYPRPPRGGRPKHYSPGDSRCDFYPRPPRGGRRHFILNGGSVRNFYPRPPRGGRQICACFRKKR